MFWHSNLRNCVLRVDLTNTCAGMPQCRNWKRQQNRGNPRSQSSKPCSKKSRLGYHCPFFRGPLICRTAQISYRYVHVPVLPSCCAFGRFLTPNSPLKQTKNPLLRTLPHQSADLALDRLVIKTCYQVVSLCPCCAFPARARCLHPNICDALPRHNSPESSSTFSRPNS